MFKYLPFPFLTFELKSDNCEFSIHVLYLFEQLLNYTNFKLVEYYGLISETQNKLF